MIWVATTNKGKLNEVKNILSDLIKENQINSLTDIPNYMAPQETGTTFEENSILKATYLSKVKPNSWIISDDSGLCVDGLDGLPGIHSARYAGERASDRQNIDKLLKMLALRSPNDRSAHFFCSMTLIDPSGKVHSFSGKAKGSISKIPTGDRGFGYDSIFVPTHSDHSFAEMLPREKNSLSHRRKCLDQMKAYLKENL